MVQKVRDDIISATKKSFWQVILCCGTEDRADSQSLRRLETGSNSSGDELPGQTATTTELQNSAKDDNDDCDGRMIEVELTKEEMDRINTKVRTKPSNVAEMSFHPSTRIHPDFEENHQEVNTSLRDNTGYEKIFNDNE